MAELKEKKYPTWINSDVITEDGINYGDCKLLYKLLLSEVIDGFLDNLNTGDDYDITDLFTRLVNLKNEIHRLEEIRKKIHEKDFKFDYDKWMKIYRLMIIEISTTLGFPKEPEYWTDNFRTLNSYIMLKTIKLLLLNPNGIPPERATYAIEKDEKILCMKTAGKLQNIIRKFNDKQNALLREKLQMLKMLNLYKFTMKQIRSEFEDPEVFIAIQQKIDKDLETRAKILYDEYNYDVKELLRVPGRGKIDLH